MGGNHIRRYTKSVRFGDFFKRSSGFAVNNDLFGNFYRFNADFYRAVFAYLDLLLTLHRFLLTTQNQDRQNRQYREKVEPFLIFFIFFSIKFLLTLTFRPHSHPSEHEFPRNESQNRHFLGPVRLQRILRYLASQPCFFVPLAASYLFG